MVVANSSARSRDREGGIIPKKSVLIGGHAYTQQERFDGGHAYTEDKRFSIVLSIFAEKYSRTRGLSRTALRWHAKATMMLSSSAVVGPVLIGLVGD